MVELRINKLVLAILLIACFSTVYVMAAANPTAPSTLTPGASSTFDEDNYAPISVDALAGNITFLTIDGIVQTRAWQGYYGNITGTITLDDASNYTFYNWSSVEPKGQIYATEASSVSWADVQCGLTGAGANNDAATFDSHYGTDAVAADNLTQTYTETDHPEFYIAERDITGCPTTYIWRDDASQTSDFVNFLLFDTDADLESSWVFGTIIENKDVGNLTDITCYNGDECDFQILVGEDGHGTDVAVTPYYFWVDLQA